MPSAVGWDFNHSVENERTLRPLCGQIEAHFQLPPRRLYRYFATFDDEYLISRNGMHFRGFHAPLASRNSLPAYLSNCYFHSFEKITGHVTFDQMVAFDNLIYIRPSTSEDTTGFVTTYAHELQHFLQHGYTPVCLL